MIDRGFRFARYLTEAVSRDKYLVGWRSALALHLVSAYNAHRPRVSRAYWPVLSVSAPTLRHPISLRSGTTDFSVLSQVVQDREYAVLDRLPLKVIVDAGAYVGFSSAYFLSRHPDAVVVAIEPDPEQARLCRENLRPYGPRARVVEAALWSHEGQLELQRGVYRDGGAWATTVTAASAGTGPVVRAIDMPAVLRETGPVDLLKLDIEGSELVLFEPGADSWLANVKHIAIEIHDEACEQALRSSLQSFDYESSRSFELTMCLNLTPKAPPIGAEAACS